MSRRKPRPWELSVAKCRGPLQGRAAEGRHARPPFSPRRQPYTSPRTGMAHRNRLESTRRTAQGRRQRCYCRRRPSIVSAGLSLVGALAPQRIRKEGAWQASSLSSYSPSIAPPPALLRHRGAACPTPLSRIQKAFASRPWCSRGPLGGQGTAPSPT